MKVRYCSGILLVGLSSCGPAHQPQAPVKNANSPVIPAPSAPPALANTSPAAPAAVASKTRPAGDNASLAEPSLAIDPKSVEAAGQVVRYYGALIGQGRISDAAGLWGDPATGRKFSEQLPLKVYLEIGKLGEAEGAAGSIYTNVPVVFHRGSFRKSAQVILRRVNDVPGSTEAQRRWHIERVDWGAAP